jgi:hypothetical protein
MSDSLLSAQCTKLLGDLHGSPVSVFQQAATGKSGNAILEACLKVLETIPDTPSSEFFEKAVQARSNLLAAAIFNKWCHDLESDAILCAAQSQNYSMFVFLEDCGLSLDIVDDETGSPLIHYLLSRKESPESLKILKHILNRMPKAISFTHEEWKEATPLVYAVFFNNPKSVDMLIASGANVMEVTRVHRKNFDATNSETWACLRRHRELHLVRRFSTFSLH